MAASSIDLYVIGVHGDSQVVAWSSATVGGVPIDQSLPPQHFDHHEISEEGKNRTRSIVEAKGSTPFGIGTAVAGICSSILLDKRVILPVSHYQPEAGCCFSLPAVLGRKGIIRTLQMPLSKQERDVLAESVESVKRKLKQVNSDML